MIQVSLEVAADELSELIDKAVHGEQVIILKDAAARVRLLPVDLPLRTRRIGGAPELLIAMADDFQAPLEDFADYMP